jgi:hypothetical protein
MQTTGNAAARHQPPLGLEVLPNDSPAVAAPYVPGLTLYHFFDWRWVSFSSFQGWMVSVASLVNAVVTAGYLRLLVS